MVATPLQVELASRRVAWAVFGVLAVAYVVYSIFIIKQGIDLRGQPPVSVSFKKQEELVLQLPCVASYYFPLNQNPGLADPGYVVAPPSPPGNGQFPNTLNISCLADPSQVERVDGQPLTNTVAEGKLRVLSMTYAYYTCILSGVPPMQCNGSDPFKYEVAEIPYTVSGNCNISIDQAEDMPGMTARWVDASEPAPNLPGPVVINFHTHHLQLKWKASTNRIAPFLTLGFHGLFFTETGFPLDSHTRKKSYTLERGALFAMHYPKDSNSCLGEPYTLDPDAVLAYQNAVKSPGVGPLYFLDMLEASSRLLLRQETLQGQFSAVGPAKSVDGYLDPVEALMGWDQRGIIYQRPGAITGVSLLPTQFWELGGWFRGIKESRDEETQWISSPSGLRTTGQEDSTAGMFPYRMFHPLNLGLYADVRGMQVSKQIDPMTGSVLLNSLHTGATIVFTIFGTIFVMREKYTELEIWPLLARLFARRPSVHVEGDKVELRIEETVGNSDGVSLRHSRSRSRDLDSLRP